MSNLETLIAALKKTSISDYSPFNGTNCLLRVEPIPE